MHNRIVFKDYSLPGVWDFFVPLTGIFLYVAFCYPQASSEERLIFLAGAVMFGGLLAFAIYRTFYLGLVWVEYDMEKVIFHYSRKEEYRFRWEADIFSVSGGMDSRERSL